MRVRHGIAAAHRIWRFLQVENDFEIVSFSQLQVREALTAFDCYGKGIDSRARLNLADRAAHALAKTMNALFKGKDFTETDLKSCL